LKLQRSHLIQASRYIFAIVAAFFISNLKLDYFESVFFDARITYRPFHSDTGHTELILIGPETTAAYQGLPGFKEHRDLLQTLAKAKPAAIVYATFAEDLRGSEIEKREFADQASTTPRLYFATDQLELKGESGRFKMAPPLDRIEVFPAPKTTDSTKFGKDGVTRRLLTSFQDRKLLHPILASLFNPEIQDPAKIRGTFELYDSVQTYINFLPEGSFSRQSFVDVVSGHGDLSRLSNKIVIIGTNTELDNKDYIFSPMSKDKATMTLAEMHANMFETLITNSAPVKAPDWLNLILTALICILTVQVVLTMKPLRGIIILASTALAFTVAAYLAFWPFGYWVDIAHPFLAIFLCYYFFIPYRLIIENRRSWEYYQKHKLLSQVEELKTNFIGLMSHDLKTPLARIQGMTEIISKDQSPLSTAQREALDMIKQSSEDLTKFISTILQYAKIESQGVQLHWQSKDINQLLLEVVKKNEFLAKVKHIHLVTELEPLFSIQVDPELIKQVFSNLIENAIKYSPENSKVLISSEEVDGKVIVQVADQGGGIAAEDVPHVFMKFFRSREAKASPVKGSGLGLYLAKYFVELHKGQINVESTPSQGSTFTVELPINGI
jgi:signal transduction histidine kinase